jgi:hypothetical protein
MPSSNKDKRIEELEAALTQAIEWGEEGWA